MNIDEVFAQQKIVDESSMIINVVERDVNDS